MPPTNSNRFNEPPFMSYDPALQAERRAAERGLKDLLLDLKLERRYGRQDWRTTRKDIRLTRARGMEDISRERTRGLRGIAYKREDVGTRSARGQQDFGFQMEDLVRSYNSLGNRQMQAANAAGTLRGGTLAAAAAKRAENFQVSRRPIDIGRERLEQDTQTELGRLTTARSDVLSDAQRQAGRLRQDTRHDLRLGRRDWRRLGRDIKLRRQRGVREQRFADVDLLQQMIFDARQRQPGVFSKYGKRGGD